MKLSNSISTVVHRVCDYYYKRRLRELEKSRETWKAKAEQRLAKISELEVRLRATEAELKKTED